MVHGGGPCQRPVSSSSSVVLSEGGGSKRLMIGPSLSCRTACFKHHLQKQTTGRHKTVYYNFTINYCITYNQSLCLNYDVTKYKDCAINIFLSNNTTGFGKQRLVLFF